MNVEEIVEGILNKNRRALARAITYVENEYPEGKEILKRGLSPHRKSSRRWDYWLSRSR